MTFPGQLLHTFPNGQQLYLVDAVPTEPQVPALALCPHLFVDDALIEWTDTSRMVKPLAHSLYPLLNHANGLHTFGAVVAPAPGQFLMWLMEMSNGQKVNTVRQSSDGLAWSATRVLIPAMGERQVTHVLDEGPGFALPQERFKTVIRDDGMADYPRWRGELWVSPDGFAWSREPENPMVRTPYGEVWSLFKRTGGYGLLHRHNWTRPVIEPGEEPFIRTIAATASGFGLSNFPPSQPVFAPGPGDEGDTHYYGVSNILRRGDLYLGCLHIYRPDVTVVGGTAGYGYTVLCWSRDGLTWQRDTAANMRFLEPLPAAETWDHAITWVTSLVPVRDQVYCYHFGAQFGHIGTDRGVGLTKIQRDRFVARQAWTATKVLRTKPVRVEAGQLFINSRGRVRVTILDADTNQPIAGFDSVVSINGLDIPIFTGTLTGLRGRLVKLQFELTNAELYGFTLA